MLNAYERGTLENSLYMKIMVFCSYTHLVYTPYVTVD